MKVALRSFPRYGGSLVSPELFPWTRTKKHAKRHMNNTLRLYRALISTASMWTTRTTSSTASGRPTPSRRISLVISVSLYHMRAVSAMQLTPIGIDGWNMTSHPMKKNEYGVFEITLPAKNNQKAISHNSKIKVAHQIHLSSPTVFANRLSKTN